MPASLSQRTTCRHSSGPKPPLTKSDEFSFTLTGNSGPTAARTARTDSSSSRARFSSVPPQASARWLVRGDRNCDNR